MNRLFISFNILLCFTNGFVFCQHSAPASPPQRVSGKAVSETTVLIEWEASLQPNGVIENYNVLYCLVADDQRPKSTWVMRNATGSSTNLLLYNLIREQTYSVAVQASNRIGTGPLSYTVQFTMVPRAKLSKFRRDLSKLLQDNEGLLPSAPTNLHATNKTAHSITLAWQKLAEPEWILGYEICITDATTGQPSVFSAVPSDEEYTLHNLMPNTAYNIRIAARSVHGRGMLSSLIQVKTAESESDEMP